jgi:hypothetical protein
MDKTSILKSLVVAFLGFLGWTPGGSVFTVRAEIAFCFAIHHLTPPS